MGFLYYRKLSLREKAYFTLVCLVGNAFGSIMLTLDVSKSFIVTFFLGTFIFGGYLGSLKCPKCGTPIMKNEIHIFGINTHFWKPIPLKNCTECGSKID